MIEIFERRACTILYNILTSIGNDKAFILPSNICPIVVAVFLKAKKKIEFVDISPETLCLNEEITLEKIKDDPAKYGGVLFVRSYGTTASFNDFFMAIKMVNDDLIIIDDKCLSVPVFDEWPSIADVNLYSTGYSKYVDLGFGAFAFMKNEIAYIRKVTTYNEEFLMQLNAGFKDAIDKKMEINFELVGSDWLDTSVPAVDFEKYKIQVTENLAQSAEIKNRFNEKFTKELPKSIQFDAQFQNWRFNIAVADKEKLLQKIFEAKLFASSHYASSSKIFYGLASPVADKLQNEIVNLFSDRYFDFKNTDRLIDIINEHALNH